MTTQTFAPGDRVAYYFTDVGGRQRHRHGVVVAVPDEYSVAVQRNGTHMMLSPDALTLLPPAKTRGPGAGRKRSRGVLRVGDVVAVCERTIDGCTPLRRYTVASVEDADGGERWVFAADGGDELVVVIDAQQRKQPCPPSHAPAQPQPPARGTGWPPSETQLMGTFEQAARMVDPNLTVGELIDAWMQYHYYDGNIVVTVPTGQRQLPADFQPPPPGWRYGDPR